MRGRRRWVRAALALVSAAGALAHPAGARGGDEDAIAALLERRAAAVRARDRAAFLATVDPKAGEFRAAQGASFDRMGAAPVADYALRLSPVRLPELTRARDGERHGAPATVRLVEERFRLDGFDETPASNDLFLTFVERDGGWLVASDADVEDLGFVTSRQPWDFGPVEVRRSEHFLLLVHPDEASFAGELLAQAGAALTEMERVWRPPWPRRVPVFVPSTRRELEGLLGGVTFDVTNFVAFAVSSVDREQGWALTGARVIINRANFLRHTPESRRRIFAHELQHVAAGAGRGPLVSRFLSEGIAELASNPGPTTILDRRVRQGSFDRRLPADLEFLAGSGEEILLAYQESLSAARFVRDRFGLDAVARIYEAFGAARVEPGTQRYHLDRALREAVGLSLDEFERGWADEVAGRSR